VKESRAGLVVLPSQPEALAAALLELEADPPRRARLGVAASHYARAYSAKAMIEKLDTLCHSLLEEKS